MASVIENNKNKPVKIRSTNGVLVNGVVDVNVRFSRCCSPVPGDEIVGFYYKRTRYFYSPYRCVNVIALPESEKSRLVDVEWQQESSILMRSLWQRSRSSATIVLVFCRYL